MLEIRPPNLAAIIRIGAAHPQLDSNGNGARLTD